MKQDNLPETFQSGENKIGFVQRYAKQNQQTICTSHRMQRISHCAGAMEIMENYLSQDQEFHGLKRRTAFRSHFRNPERIKIRRTAFTALFLVIA
jgi:hypothetical protein